MLTKRTGRCAVARREPDGGHAAQHLSGIEMASRRLCPPYGFDVTGTCSSKLSRRTRRDRRRFRSVSGLSASQTFADAVPVMK